MTADELINKILDHLNNNNSRTTNSYTQGFGNEISDISSQLRKLKDTLKFMKGDFDEVSGKTRKQLEKEEKYLEDLDKIREKEKEYLEELNKIKEEDLDKRNKLLKDIEDLSKQRYELELANLSAEQKRQNELKKQHEKLSSFIGDEAASKIESGSIARTVRNANTIGNKEASAASKAAAWIEIANMVGDYISAWSNAIGNYMVKDIEKQQESVAYQYDVLKKTFATNSKLATKQLEIQGKALTKHLSGVTSFLTKGVKESAFEIGNTALEVNADLLKYRFEKYFAKQNLEQELYVRQEENKRTMNRLNREQIEGAISGYMDIFDSATGGVLGGVTGAVKSITANINKVRGARDALEIQKLNAEMEYQKQMRDFVQQSLDQMTNTLQNYAKQGLELVSQMEDVGLRIDKNIKEGMKSLGYTNYESYKNTMQKLTQSLAVSTSGGKTFYLDKTDEDIAKYQDEYVRNTGRSIEMSAEGTQKAFLMSELWDENTVNSLTSQMDYFNHSIEDSVDMFYEMYQTANRAGISNKKYAETLNKNLKLAQKYTFKGGTEGLMKMAIWAEKTRFNMDSLDSMISKVQEGGLEGTITQAAQLQVLGGHAAMGADPLAMQYEAWSDPEAFAERMYDMTREYASFNAETGEVDIKGLNARMVAAIAKAQGRSPEDLRAELSQRMKNEKIDSQISGMGFTDEQKQLLYSKAQYDKNDGRWKINVNGEKRDINTLSESDFNKITPVEKNIEDYVYNIWDWLKNNKGATNFASTQLGFDTMGNTIENAQERINNNIKWFSNNAETLKQMVENGSNWITEEDNKYKELLTKNAENFKVALDTLSTDTEKLQTQINNASRNFKEFSEALELEGEAFVEAMKPILAEMGVSLEGLIPTTSKNQKDEFGDTPWQSIIRGATVRGTNTYGFEELKTRLRTVANTNKKDGKYDWESIVKSEEFKNIVSKGWGDIENRASEKLGIGYDNWTAEDAKSLILAMEEINKQIESGERDRMYLSFNDGLLSSNGRSMLTAASNITPIHDGSVQLAKSDPRDTAIFAKSGGPFDTLFNGIFAKINDIYSNVLPRSMEYTMPMETTIGKIFDSAKYTANNSKLQMETVKVEINGRLELTSGNGQSIDIIGELRNNPILLRQLTQMISENVSKSINGGRATYDGITTTARFKGMGL